MMMPSCFSDARSSLANAALKAAVCPTKISFFPAGAAASVVMGSSAPVTSLRWDCNSFAAVCSGAMASAATTMAYDDLPSAARVTAIACDPIIAVRISTTEATRSIVSLLQQEYSPPPAPGGTTTHRNSNCKREALRRTRSRAYFGIGRKQQERRRWKRRIRPQ